MDALAAVGLAALHLGLYHVLPGSSPAPAPWALAAALAPAALLLPLMTFRHGAQLYMRHRRAGARARRRPARNRGSYCMSSVA